MIICRRHISRLLEEFIRCDSRALYRVWKEKKQKTAGKPRGIHPRKLLKYLTKTRGYTVEETSPGIYLISGDYVPIQIIESGKLSEQENLWLKSLVKDLQAASAGSIINEKRKRGDKAQLGAYLEVLISANPEAFMEAENMARKKRKTLEEVFTEAGFIPEWTERARVEGKREGEQNIINLLKSGKSAEEIIQLMENGIVGMST